MVLLDFSSISYLSLEYFVLVGVSLIIYYIIPTRFKEIQWTVLLVVSTVFYYLIVGENKCISLLFIGTVLFSYVGARVISRHLNGMRMALLICTAVISMAPLLFVKCSVLIRPFIHKDLVMESNFIVPVGLSFYSLQSSYILGVMFLSNTLNVIR